MVEGDERYFTCNLPYQLSAYHGLMTEERVKAILEDENMSPIDFTMEMCAQFWKQNGQSFFKVEDFLRIRKLYKPWYPPTDEQWVSEKKKMFKSWEQKRTTEKELRVLSCDIALMGSEKDKDNDLAVFTYFKCVPKKDNYIAQILYQETHEGWSARKLASRIKQLYTDGDMDYIVLDANGNGLPVLDELGMYTEYKSRGITLPPLKAFNADDLEERCGYREAKPVVFGMRANKSINHEIAVTLQASIHNKRIECLVNQIEAEDWLIQNIDGYNQLSVEEQIDLQMPYLQTTLIQNEIIELKSEVKEGYIRVFEKRGNRKDRYSSVAYGNYFIRQKEKELKDDGEADDEFLNLW